MVKHLDRYIGVTVIGSVLVVWLGLTLLMMLFSLLNQLGSSGANPVSDVFWYVLLTAPRSAYQMFPVAALLGAMIGLGGLAAANELVALRTSGVSRLRIAGSALATTFLLAVPAMGLGEWVAPAAEEQARAFEHSRILGRVSFGGPRGIWMRDGSQIVNIQYPLLAADRGQHTVEFRNVVIYSFNPASRLDRMTVARRASHDGEQWRLERVRTIDFDEDAVRRGWARQLEWDTTVRPELLDAAVTRPRYMSIRTLLDQIDYLGANGLDDRIHQSALWAKIFFPLTALSLVLAGMPFVFGSARLHSLGLRLFIGMSLGGLFMIVSRAVQNMGDAYSLPVTLSTAGPALILAGVVFLVLRRAV